MGLIDEDDEEEGERAVSPAERNLSDAQKVAERGIWKASVATAQVYRHMPSWEELIVGQRR
jgi:uncharacterized protein (UPF0332 family)